jgi:hypothetical protein
MFSWADRKTPPEAAPSALHANPSLRENPRSAPDDVSTQETQLSMIIMLNFLLWPL